MTMIANGDIEIADFRGLVLPYAGSSAPTGWLLCDGAEISRTTYSDLFALIGTTYGVGNGSTTFNIPDLRGRVIMGVGTGTKVATFASRSSNVITVTGLSNKANNEFQTGQAVVYHTTGSVITGLSNDATYYVVRTGNLTFSLASSLADAQNGSVITLSGDGTGTQTFTLTLAVRALGDTGGEENHAMSSGELIAHTHEVGRNGSSSGGDQYGFYGTTQLSGSKSLTDARGGNAAMNNMQPFVTLNYIIKY
jgi:microcystin-dependent protein